MKLILALGIVLLSSTNVLAVELANKDDKAYTVKVTEGTQTQEISLEAGAKQEVCKAECQIDIDGLGSINATGTETLSIEKGAIVVPPIQM
jgi:hypothetical protein